MYLYFLNSLLQNYYSCSNNIFPDALPQSLIFASDFLHFTFLTKLNDISMLFNLTYMSFLFSEGFLYKFNNVTFHVKRNI